MSRLSDHVSPGSFPTRDLSVVSGERDLPPRVPGSALRSRGVGCPTKSLPDPGRPSTTPPSPTPPPSTPHPTSTTTTVTASPDPSVTAPTASKSRRRLSKSETVLHCGVLFVGGTTAVADVLGCRSGLFIYRRVLGRTNGWEPPTVRGRFQEWETGSVGGGPGTRVSWGVDRVVGEGLSSLHRPSAKPLPPEGCTFTNGLRRNRVGTRRGG